MEYRNADCSGREGIVEAAQLAAVVRSGVEESVHYGDVAVCSPSGTLLFSAGDPRFTCFPRSALKPVQAVVSASFFSVEPEDDELAVMSASHQAEPQHLRVVRRLLARARLTEEDLGCPPALPLGRRVATTGLRPRRELHNCSGKHAGMLVACVESGQDPATYLELDHGLQRSVRRAVLDLTGLDEVAWGVDGCGAPVPALPVEALATLFARLGDPTRVAPSDHELAPQLDRTRSAMRLHPFLVGGTGAFDTELMRLVPDVVAKSGAEGVACASIPSRSVGVAVKIRDGSARAAGPVLVRALRHLGAIPGDDESAVAQLERPAVVGGGRRVGELVASFDLSGH